MWKDLNHRVTFTKLPDGDFLLATGLSKRQWVSKCSNMLDGKQKVETVFPHMLLHDVILRIKFIICSSQKSNRHQ